MHIISDFKNYADVYWNLFSASFYPKKKKAFSFI